MSIQLKGGTASAMALLNPTLLARQPGVETDTGRFKIGDGVTAWSALPYAIGPQGLPMQSPLQGDDGEIGPPGLLGSSGAITRSGLSVDAKNWSFLGTASAAATTVGPVVWFGIYRQIMIKYFIAGYNGGTPVGRILLGSASISTTALTNSWKISEDFAAATVGQGVTAVPGVPLAVTLSAVERGGWISVDGASGSLKEILIQGRNQNLAVATAPTMFFAVSAFSDLGTNLPIQRAQLTVYDTLAAVAASVQTFTAGTYLAVWGRNTD